MFTHRQLLALKGLHAKLPLAALSGALFGFPFSR